MSGARPSIPSSPRAAIGVQRSGLHIVHTIVTNGLGGRVNLDSDPTKEQE